MNEEDERAKEFLGCLGNGKTIYQIESEEEENEETQEAEYEGKREEIGDNAFFSGNNISDITQNSKENKLKGGINPRTKDRNAILQKIKQLAPINIFQLRKKLEEGGSKISYSVLFGIVRELEFVRLIKTKMITNKDGREERIIELYKEVKK